MDRAHGSHNGAQPRSLFVSLVQGQVVAAVSVVGINMLKQSVIGFFASVSSSSKASFAGLLALTRGGQNKLF